MQEATKKFDLFTPHASENKGHIVRSLANALKETGFDEAFEKTQSQTAAYCSIQQQNP